MILLYARDTENYIFERITRIQGQISKQKYVRFLKTNSPTILGVYVVFFCVDSKGMQVPMQASLHKAPPLDPPPARAFSVQRCSILLKDIAHQREIGVGSSSAVGHLLTHTPEAAFLDEEGERLAKEHLRGFQRCSGWQGFPSREVSHLLGKFWKGNLKRGVRCERFDRTLSVVLKTLD